MQQQDVMKQTITTPNGAYQVKQPLTKTMAGHKLIP